MAMIPMVDLKAQYAHLAHEIEAGLRGVFENCEFILGPNVQAFEREVADYLGVDYAIGVASGTDALHLALAAAGIGAGDEVITTPFTFIATAEAIRYVGARPVFVDIDPRSFNIDPDAIEHAVTERTKAIMPVHLFGQPANLPSIQEICHRFGLKLIEDCAQSFGASLAGRQTGSFGDAAGFSFFPSKNLGAYGDGGLITTQSDDLAQRVRMLRNHGSRERYRHEFVGFNSRLDEIQAVILLAKLKHIEKYNENRRRVARLYSKLMAELPLEIPYEDGIGEHVYHQYTLLVDQREDVMTALRHAGIASAIYYPVPVHTQSAFSGDCAGLQLPVAEAASLRCLSLPIYPELSDRDVERIVGVVESVVGR